MLHLSWELLRKADWKCFNFLEQRRIRVVLKELRQRTNGFCGDLKKKSAEHYFGRDRTCVYLIPHCCLQSLKIW